MNEWILAQISTIEIQYFTTCRPIYCGSIYSRYFCFIFLVTSSSSYRTSVPVDGRDGKGRREGYSLGVIARSRWPEFINYAILEEFYTSFRNTFRYWPTASSITLLGQICFPIRKRRYVAIRDYHFSLDFHRENLRRANPKSLPWMKNKLWDVAFESLVFEMFSILR